MLNGLTYKIIKTMKRVPVYMDEHIYLERIQLPYLKDKNKIGQPRWFWRQVTNINDELEVKETNNEPDWYIRHKKLNNILDEQDKKLG
jgi:hypothetical protein